MSACERDWPSGAQHAAGSACYAASMAGGDLMGQAEADLQAAWLEQALGL